MIKRFLASPLLRPMNVIIVGAILFLWASGALAIASRALDPDAAKNES